MTSVPRPFTHGVVCMTTDAVSSYQLPQPSRTQALPGEQLQLSSSSIVLVGEVTVSDARHFGIALA